MISLQRLTLITVLSIAVLISFSIIFSAEIPQSASVQGNYNFSGRVYSGNVGDENNPLSGVTVAVYGANNPYPDPGNFIASTTTGADGWYGLEASSGYEFYSIRETDPSGYQSQGATSVSGTVRTSNWIEYVVPIEGKTLTGNKFWDSAPAAPSPTPTPEPSPTPDQTPDQTPTERWCCINSEVMYIPQEVCTAEGGQMFTTESEAIVSCQVEQPSEGWCCLNGDVFPAPDSVCQEEGGLFSTSEGEATNSCQGDEPSEGWCCLNGDVFYGPQEPCLQEGGIFLATEDQTIEACQSETPREGWCCLNGGVSFAYAQTCIEERGAFFDTEEDAWAFCETGLLVEGWCCLNGDVFPCPDGVCEEVGGSFFDTSDEALDNCRVNVSQEGWCCSNGDIVSSSGEACVAEEGSFFEEAGDALAVCEETFSPDGWCYNDGDVFPSPGGVCAAGGGSFFDSADDAVKHWGIQTPGPVISDTVPPEDVTHKDDMDGDGIFNDQDDDMDGDGIKNDDDNCMKVYNPNQKDREKGCQKFMAGPSPASWCYEGDDVGDACDNCPDDYNKYQTDWDGDTVGDACDNCSSKKNTNQTDSDGDKIGDACDNCIKTSNYDQTDYDTDKVGDACDNCIDSFNPNPDQKDSDKDGIGDPCDVCPKANDKTDTDKDGVPDCNDNCPGVKNPYQHGAWGKKWQDDQDNDNTGDACDCDDGVWGPSEKGVDCGGPCTKCGYVAIKGRILYEEASSDGKTSAGFKPVRFGKFQLRLGKDYPFTTQASLVKSATDSNGYFNIVVARNSIKSAYVFLGNPTDLYSINYAVRLAKDLDGCNEYISWHGKTFEIPKTGDLNLGDLRIGIDKNLEFTGHWEETYKGFCSWDGNETGKIDGGSAYFNIAETVLVAREYADGLRSDTDSISYVDVEWPDTEKSSYNSFWEEIQLLPERGFSDGTIIHEFGHHLQEEISENDDYWGDSSHDLCTADKDEEFGWKEGFSEYFGTIIPHHHQDSSDPRFLSGPNVGYSSAENQCSCNVSNEEQECTVLAVLWDLVDDPTDTSFTLSSTESFDTVSNREAIIFAIFDSELDNFGDAPDLCEFIEEGWDCRLSGTQRDAIDAILTQYNVKCSRGCGK